MPRLYVLRHAKSSWDEPDLADIERPLAPRGRKASAAIGEYMREHDFAPELVLCSPAVRARETLRRLELEGADVLADPEFYAASVGDLLHRLQQLPDSVGSAMVIGHNPVVQHLALTVAAERGRYNDLRRGFPTCALATFDLPDPWLMLAPGCGEVVDYVVPREL